MPVQDKTFGVFALSAVTRCANCSYSYRALWSVPCYSKGPGLTLTSGTQTLYITHTNITAASIIDLESTCSHFITSSTSFTDKILSL